MVRNSREMRQAIRGGAIAGLIAGAVLTLVMTVMSLTRHTDIWYGMKGAAAPFFGERAMQPGFDALPVGIGLVAHLIISVAWAVPFALIVAGIGRWSTIVAAAAWGIVVWIGMFYVVLPMVGLRQMSIEAPVGRAIAYHVFYGLAVGAAFAGYQRYFVRGGRLPRRGRLLEQRVRSLYRR